MSERFNEATGMKHGVEQQIESELFLDPERWQNTSVQTFSFRRHAEWHKPNTKNGVPGSLTEEGVRQAKHDAIAWAKGAAALFGETDQMIVIGESPTAIISRSEVNTPAPTEGEKKKKNMRAVARTSITGAIFEKALAYQSGLVVKEQAPQKAELESERLRDTTGGPRENQVLPYNRAKRPFLGDYGESLDADFAELDPDTIPAELERRLAALDTFEGLVKEQYGGKTAEFWHAFVTDTLPEPFITALEEAHCSNGRELAQRFVSHLESAGTEVEEGAKYIELDFTHEETMRSFLFQLGSYAALQDSNWDQNDTTTLTSPIDYIEGFDAHVTSDGELVVNRSEQSVSVNLTEFKRYLDPN